MVPWKVLVVDDEEGIHGITRMVFRGYEFEKRPIELISAMSGAEARHQLMQHPDIALALLDVVMESDSEGLQLVEYIRNELNNHDIRIVLRTGHPGYAPEAQVIVNYDINDYLSKAELSASRLLTSVVVGLRSFRDIKSARTQVTNNEDNLSSENLFAVNQLHQQMTPIIKLSERLQQLELNPVAQDITANLHAQHQRLHNSISLLNTTEHPFQAELIKPAHLLNEVLQIFLPQCRRDGWLLDYRLDSALPKQLTTDVTLLKQLLISIIELAILSANGQDLKLTIQPAKQAGNMLVSIKQITGTPIYSTTYWPKLLQQYIQRLSIQLQGRCLDNDESGAINCVLPY